MASYRQVLSVFLASPGDVVPERLAAKEVVEDLAMPARELGVSLELLGWEDTLPGASRPQEMINRDLDKADLFVGVLWRRWGQPTGHPDFSSGFEEEYFRSRTRRTQSGSPEMWLFFKEIEPALLQDPGEQLQKVLLFKEHCVLEKQMFFKEFKSTEEWTRMLRKALLLHLVRDARNVTNEPAGEGLHLFSHAKANTQKSEAASTTAPSLLPLVDVLNNLANGANPRRYATKDGALYSARLYLIGLSLLAESQTSSDLASTHEMNTLFRLRSAFEPLPVEQSLLERSVLADRAGVKPGWYWFPQDEEGQLKGLLSYALSDPETDVRRGALTLLASERIRRNDWASILFDVKTADAQPKDVQDAYWAYLEAIVAASERQLLEAMQDSEMHRERVVNLIRIVRTAGEPGPVLAEAATAPQAPSQRLVRELIVNIRGIDAAVLTAAFSSRHETLRSAIAMELERRQLISDIRTAAQNDESETIRILEFRDRLRSAPSRGGEIPPLPEGLSFEAKRFLALERFRGLTFDELNQKIDWFNLDATAAYEVLATDYWEHFANQVRVDVAENFDRIRRESTERAVQRVIEASGTTKDEAVCAAVQKSLKLKDDLDTFLRRQFAIAALAAIERHGSSEDASFVRGFLRSSLERDTAIRALARVGDETDVAPLVQIAAESYGDTRVLAAGVALQLSGNSKDVIRKLSESNESDVVRLALLKMEEQDDESLRATATKLLKNDNASIREVAV